MGTLEYKQLTATLQASGTLQVPNNNKANATSLFGGVVKSIAVQTGSLVKKGQVIATIANPQFLQLQEEYLTTANKIVLAEQELARQKELNEGNAGMLKNLQAATAELNSLRTRRASLHQQLILMGISPTTLTNGKLQSHLTVTSPISGTVSNVFSKIGSYVDVSSPVVEVVDNGSLHLDLNVFEKDLPALRVGQIIHFTLTNNPTQEYDAKIYSIGTSFENDSKTIPIHCEVLGNKKGLIDGMNITAVVSLDDVTSPAVPNEAIVEAEGKYFVFVVVEDKTVPKADHTHDGHAHDEHSHVGHTHDTIPATASTSSVNFKKVEVLKGASYMGYTAVTFIADIPEHTQIVKKGAYFINAKLTNQGEAHAH
jgi:RND family efflux transporter MFP subunit